MCAILSMLLLGCLGDSPRKIYLPDIKSVSNCDGKFEAVKLMEGGIHPLDQSLKYIMLSYKIYYDYAHAQAKALYKQPRHLEKLIGIVDQELNNVRLSPTHSRGYWLSNILNQYFGHYLGNSIILKTTSSCDLITKAIVLVVNWSLVIYP